MTEDWHIAVELLRSKFAGRIGPENCVTRLANNWKMKNGMSPESAEGFFDAYADLDSGQIMETARYLT